MTNRDFGVLLLAAALFGSSFLFIRVAAPAFGPVTLMAARVSLAGAGLLLFALARRRSLSLGGRGLEWFALAAVNFAVPFVLLAWAELHVTSSLAAMFIAALPLCTTLVAALWMREPLTRRKLAGLALGLAGVGLLTGWNPVRPEGLTGALAMAALLAMPVLYAVGAVYTRQRFRHVPAFDATTLSLLASGALLLPLVPFALPPAPPPLAASSALAALALLCTAVAYLLFFHLIGRVGPVATSTAAYLIPFFGALWGALILGEPLTPMMLLAFLIILAAVSLVGGVGWRRPRAPAT